LAGDEKYAPAESVKAWKERGLKRLFLHAHRLEFLAPSGEVMEFSAALPDPLRTVLDAMETRK
jgi:23S rRNA pseudouridine955/2504/2580 synthase